MGKARVATKIVKIAAIAAGFVPAVAATHLIGVAPASAAACLIAWVSSTVVLPPPTNYRNISVQTSNQQTVETPPSSFKMDQLAYVPEIAREAKADVQKAGVDSYAIATKQDIERLVENALPYMAHKLKTGRVNVPSIHLEKTDEWSGRYSRRRNRIMIMRAIALEDAAIVIPHELTHAQFAALPGYKRIYYTNVMTGFPFGKMESNPNNETRANVLALEVLANQTLDGDILARQVFFQSLDKWLKVRERKESGVKISGVDFRYSYRSGEAVVAALSGVKPEYGGIKLDGTVKLIRQETKRMAQSSRRFSETP